VFLPFVVKGFAFPIPAMTRDVGDHGDLAPFLRVPS
jgi:hypothetical protein